MQADHQTSPVRQDWRRPAGICLSLAILGALLGGAIWVQTAGPASPPKTHGYPLMPTVPVKIGFYDMHGRSAAGDPVLKQFGKMHLDYVLLQNIFPTDHASVAKILGMTAAMPGIAPPGFRNDVLARLPLTDIWPLESRHAVPPPAQRSPVVPYNTDIIGIWAEGHVGDRVIRLASISPPANAAHPAFETLEKSWENLVAPPAPLPPIIVALDDASRLDARDLVHPSSGWFDASSVFWDKSESPPPGHLLFSSGWSLTGGQVVRDPHDPLHRVGWVITTAGAAPPATQAAGEGEE